MKVAVIAWGSLIREPEALQIAADFAAVGPQLPIEFCRISTTGARKDCLTLVIDQDDGTLCRSYAAPSGFDTLEAAIQNLVARERTPLWLVASVLAAWGTWTLTQRKESPVRE